MKPEIEKLLSDLDEIGYDLRYEYDMTLVHRNGISEINIIGDWEYIKDTLILVLVIVSGTEILRAAKDMMEYSSLLEQERIFLVGFKRTGPTKKGCYFTTIFNCVHRLSSTSSV